MCIKYYSHAAPGLLTAGTRVRKIQYTKLQVTIINLIRGVSKLPRGDGYAKTIPSPLGRYRKKKKKSKLPRARPKIFFSIYIIIY